MRTAQIFRCRCCQKQFSRLRRGHRYQFCSRRCSSRLNNVYRRKILPEIVCACGCQRVLPENVSAQSRYQRRARRVKFIRGHSTRGKNRTPGPTRRPTLTDIAWMAGIYEGEGSCASRHGCATVTIGQSGSPWLPEKLRSLVGGTVNGYKRKQNGKMYQDHYLWQANSTFARGFLMTIYSFLSPRRKGQIRRALSSAPSVS